MNKNIVTIILIIIGLFCADLIMRVGNVILMAIPFLAYLAIGILRAPANDKIQLNAHRSLKKSSVNGLLCAEVCVTINNNSKKMILLRLSDPLKPLMEILDGKLEQVMILKGGEKKSLRYSFKAVRGYYVWESIRAVIIDPLGLLETEIQLSAKGEFIIHPHIKKFKPILLRPHSTLHSPGSVPARLGGLGTDFWGIREYHHGDSLRWLDWRLTARYPHKFFTREFEQEEIADIGLILDARQKTNLILGGDSLFEYSVSAVTSLSEMFLHQGHRLSMMIFGEKVETIFPGFGKTQLNRVLRSLAKVKVGQNRTLDSIDNLPLRFFPNHSLIIIISPLTPKDWSLFPVMRAYGHNVLLINPDTIDFSSASLGDDPVTLLAIRAARLKRRLKLHRISQLKISVIDWKVKQKLLPLVRNALTNVRGQ